MRKKEGRITRRGLCRPAGRIAASWELDMIAAWQKVLPPGWRTIDYDRKMVNDVNVEIHGVKFKADFVVLDLGSYDARLIVWITHFDFDETEKSRKDTLPNPLIAEYEKRNKNNTITYRYNLIEALGYQGLAIKACLMLMVLKRELSIDDEVYLEWVLEVFSTMNFDKDVDKSNLMMEKCIWFRLCRNEHILTLPEFAIVLGLFMEDKIAWDLCIVIDLLEEIGSSSEEVVKMGKANRNKGYNINNLTPPPSLKLEEIPSTSTIPPQPIYYPLTSKQREKMKEKCWNRSKRYRGIESYF
ncbi:hypothetical protein Tco_0855816 [Tanacetum coccineum]